MKLNWKPSLNERLRLAFDCALECDVPPQETQRMLAECLKTSLRDGALKHSEHLRDSLASSVDRLLASAGVEMFEQVFLEGMQSEQPTIAAAFIDFVGRLKEAVQFSPLIFECFEKSFVTRKDTVIRTACAGALMRQPEFRSESAVNNLGACLKGNLIEKHAAVKALESNPGLARRFQSELTLLLDDPSQIIASSAAHCVLVAGFSPDEFESRKTQIRKAVTKWQVSERKTDSERLSIVLHPSFLQKLLNSDKPADVSFAASLVPLGDFDSKQSHKLLMDTLRGSENHLIARSCLDSLRKKDGALDLITLAETDYICELVRSKYRDVRIGAIKVLGMLPNDEQVVSTLLSVCGMGGDSEQKPRFPDELEEGIKALAEHARKDSTLQRRLVIEVLSALPEPRSQQFGDEQQQRQTRSMLAACEKIGAFVDEKHSTKLLELARDFRTPEALRSHALRVYARTIRPSASCVRELCYFLKRDDKAINEASYAAVFWFLAQCRKRVEYVRAVYGELPTLRTVLIQVWKREKNRLVDRIDSVGIEDIRQSLSELESLIVSYAEFSERMKLTENRSSQSV